MARYRKKPVVIDATQWTGKNYDEIRALEEGSYRSVRFVKNDSTLIIATFEGDHKANVGDYIINGIAGELYPCKPDIFEATYEKEDEARSELEQEERDRINGDTCDD